MNMPPFEVAAAMRRQEDLSARIRRLGLHRPVVTTALDELRIARADLDARPPTDALEARRRTLTRQHLDAQIAALEARA